MKYLLQILLLSSLLFLFSPNVAAQHDYVAAAWHPTEDVIAVVDNTHVYFYSSTFNLLNQVQIIENDRPARIIQFRWSPDGTRFALDIFDLNEPITSRVLEIWDYSPIERVSQISGYVSTDFAWSPTSDYIAVGQFTKPIIVEVYIFRVIDGELVSKIVFPYGTANVDEIAWNPNNQQLAILTNKLEIWDISNLLQPSYIGEVNKAFSGDFINYKRTNMLLAFTPSSNPNTIEIWNTTQLQLVQTLVGHSEPIWQWTWGNNVIATVSFDGTTRIWNPDTGETLTVIETGVTNTLSFSPDDTKFVAIDEHMQVVIRDTLIGEILATLTVPPDENE